MLSHHFNNLIPSPIGLGAFKIGRNIKTKYTTPYDLPDEAASAKLLHAALDMGINLIDTAPAYGSSEERIGRAIAYRRDEYILCTKVGEQFMDGASQFDFTGPAVRRSIHESLRRLKTDVIDIVHIHSDGNDAHIMMQTDCVPTLMSLREQGHIRAIGLSAKTLAGAQASLDWADSLMIEYHLQDPSPKQVITQAAAKGIAIFIKKGLASGTIPAQEAIAFIMQLPQVTSLIIGSLNASHLASNLQIARDARAKHMDAP